MSVCFQMDEEICSSVSEEPLSGAVEERNTAEESEAPAPPRVAWENNTPDSNIVSVQIRPTSCTCGVHVSQMWTGSGASFVTVAYAQNRP
ncbi:unnamed protein product [Leuciscus chuanchicus]